MICTSIACKPTFCASRWSASTLLRISAAASMASSSIFTTLDPAAMTSLDFRVASASFEICESIARRLSYSSSRRSLKSSMSFASPLSFSL